MFKKINSSELPKWLKVVLNVFLVITVDYLIGWLFYKTLNAIRWLLHNATKPEIWWWTVMMTLVASVVVLVIIQTQTDLDPIGSVVRNILDNVKNVRTWLGEIIIDKK